MSSEHAHGIDLSHSGARIRCTKQIPIDAADLLEGKDGHPSGYSNVRYCLGREGAYLIGLEFTEETKQTVGLGRYDGEIDYYEFLQISPKAELPTIQRIYRFLASRFHPDNPETRDPEKFLLLTRAYDVLSNPETRAEYDARRETHDVRPAPIFGRREFVNGIEGEVNRRLGVLSLLYNQRRTNPENPKVSLYELERRMGWPREYLDFTTWYLRSKQYIVREDNSDFTLTALGVDYIESNYSQIPMLDKLLNSGSHTATSNASSNGRALQELLLAAPEEPAGETEVQPAGETEVPPGNES